MNKRKSGSAKVGVLIVVVIAAVSIAVYRLSRKDRAPEPDLAEKVVAPNPIEPEKTAPETLPPETPAPESIEVASTEPEKPAETPPDLEPETVAENLPAPKPEKVQPEPKEAPVVLSSRPSPELEAIYLALEGAGSTQLAELLKRARGLSDPDQGAAIAAIAVAMSNHDSRGAIALLEELPSEQSSMEALMQILGGWMRTDTEKALAYIMNLNPEKDPMFLQTAAFSGAQGVSSEQPEEAVKLVELLPTGDLRYMLLEVMAAKIGREGAEQAEDWVQALPEGEIRDAGMFGVAVSLGLENVEETMAWIETLAQGSLREAARGGMVVALLNSDLNRALEMILDVEEGLGRDRGMTRAVEFLTLKDAEGAVEWIEELPGGRIRDHAYQSHIFMRYQVEKVFQKDLVERIEDLSIREAVETKMAEINP